MCSASIATHVAMRRARVSGRLASAIRYRIAYLLALLRVAKKALAVSFPFGSKMGL